MGLILIKQPALNLRNLTAGRDSKTGNLANLNLLLSIDYQERLSSPRPCYFHYYVAGDVTKKRKLAFDRGEQATPVSFLKLTAGV